MPASRPLEIRFWEKVVILGPDECWEWTGSKDQNGYGRINRCGRKGPVCAQRIAWELHNNKSIPPRMYACHHCDNPGCVNPRHIFLGTPKDNVQDMIAKGRRVAKERQTHCQRGHEFTDKNSMNCADGKRRCRACCYARTNARRNKKKGK